MDGQRIVATQLGFTEASVGVPPPVTKPQRQPARQRSKDVALTPAQRVNQALGACASNLYHYVSTSGAVLGTKVAVSLRPDGTWLAVLKYDDVETLKAMVCFGSGGTVGDALVGLSSALQRGKARLDRPYVG
jgi:hypothetical protein